MLSYGNDTRMAFKVNLAIAFYFLCLTSTKLALGIKPHFTSEPDKLMAAYQEDTVNFTWTLSNHSFNTLYFGTWKADINTLDNTIMSLVRNGSKTSIYTSKKESVKEYRGRVRWTGDLSTDVVSFELTNIKQIDHKYYGLEVEFNDDMMTEVSGSTQLIVKSRSVFTSSPSHITQPARSTASFTWRYRLSMEDQASLSALVFGVYRKENYDILCTTEVREKAIISSNCSTSRRKPDIRFNSALPTSMATFVLDNLSPGDEGIYSLRLGGTRELMENKTRLLVRGIKPHFTSEPDKLIAVYQEDTVNFTWTLSNHSFNTLYFGTWKADINTLGNTLMSLVRNGSKTSIYTIDKENVKEYRGRVRWTGDLSTGVVSFELTNIKQTDDKHYGLEIEFNDDKMTEVCGFTQLVVKSKSVDVKGIKPHFTSEPDKLIAAYQEGTVNFTWTISNHSFNTLYFGTWKADINTLGNTLMSLVHNGSKTTIYTIDKENVKEYRGRVRWTGDLSTGVVSFELTNIKQTDHKHYGLEVEFNDDNMTEVSGSTQLVVKSKPVVEKESNPCKLNKGGCSHLCVFSSETKSQTCRCPTGMDLSSDDKTCVMVSGSTTPPSPTTISGAVTDQQPAVKMLLVIVAASIFIAL